MEINGLLHFIQVQPFDCLILPHPSIRVLASTLEKVQQHFLYPPLNIGAELSEELIHVIPRKRGVVAQDLFERMVQANEADIVLCTGIDLLFEPSLSIDPLMVIRRVARIKRIIVFWAGSFHEAVLAYANTGHHHYRTWRISADWTSSPALHIYPLTN
jgi:hypothetical protein